MFRDKIRTAIGQVLHDVLAESGLGQFDMSKFSVEAPEHESRGDYASNVAMVIAKAAKKNPMELAELLAKKLSAGGHVFIEKAEAAAPGFVNLRLADDELAASAARALVQPREWGTSSAGTISN